MVGRGFMIFEELWIHVQGMTFLCHAHLTVLTPGYDTDGHNSLM